MATSSIFLTPKIKGEKQASAFIDALETSQEDNERRRIKAETFLDTLDLHSSLQEDTDLYTLKECIEKTYEELYPYEEHVFNYITTYDLMCYFKKRYSNNS